MLPLKDRQIYKYHDGNSEVLGDPVSISRHFLVDIQAQGYDPEQLFKTISEPANDIKRYSEAMDTLLPAIRQAFNVKPLSHGGLTEGETLNLLADFLSFQANLKKNTETSQSGLEHTDSPPDTDSQGSDSLDSGLIVKEFKTRKPRKSPKG